MAAVEALKKAADQGNAVAQYNLGTMVCQLLRIPNALQTSAHLLALNLLLLLIAWSQAAMRQFTTELLVWANRCTAYERRGRTP